VKKKAKRANNRAGHRATPDLKSQLRAERRQLLADQDRLQQRLEAIDTLLE
jgi:hypothetical protein